MTDAEFWLSRNLKETFGLPDDAAQWLMAGWNLMQAFDDMADGVHPNRDELDRAICDAFVNMPENPFFLEHRAVLIPLMAVAILKWKASDTTEREGQANAMSYAWRAGFYDIVLAVIQICHGQQVAMDVCHRVMALYGEDYGEYLREFTHA